MTAWVKIPDAPYWLEIWKGPYKTSYRVFFRADGISIRKKLKGDFKSWKDAKKAGEILIGETKYGRKKKAKSEVATETLCDEIIGLSKTKSEATYEQTDIFMRVHIKPYLRGECAYEKKKVKGQEIIEPCQHRPYIDQGACPYASDLNPTTWLMYKTHIRLHRPTVALFNHWKFFGMLFNYAHGKGILPKPIKLEFDEEKEDDRKPGILMSDEEFRKLIGASEPTWVHRSSLQRMTGQRPGVIRKLRKNQVNFDTGVVLVEKADSKNRRRYSFVLPEQALETLKGRLLRKNVMASPYFFPQSGDPSQPMDRSLTGWHSAIARAGINPDFTPHDLRHTFLTHKFKSSPNPALVCYQCDLSLEEAMKTYIHFSAEDTRGLAEETAAQASSYLTPIAPEPSKAQGEDNSGSKHSSHNSDIQIENEAKSGSKS
jgi:hypothetical protein